MSAVSFGGLASGMDTDQIINALLQIEARPIRRYESRIETHKKTQGAFRDLNNRVSNLMSKVDALGDADTYEQMKLHNTHTDVLSASIVDDEKAIEGTYEMFVEELAKTASVRSGRQINDQKMFTNDGQTSVSNTRVTEGVGRLNRGDSLVEALESLEKTVELSDAGQDDFEIEIRPFGTVEEDYTIGIDIQQFMDANPDASLEDFIDHVNDEITAANPNGIQRLRFDYDRSRDRFHFVPTDQRGDDADPVNVSAGGSTFALNATAGNFDNDDHAFLRAVGIMESSAKHDFTQRPSEQADPQSLLSIQSGVNLEDATFTNKVSASGQLRVNSTIINYNADDDSLESVMRKINRDVEGVTASYNSLTDRMTLRSEQEGAGEIEIEDVEGNLGSVLNLLDGSETGQEAGDYVDGQDARVSVDGLSVTADGSTLEFEGIRVNIDSLHTEGENPDDPVTLNVSQDLSGATRAVGEFVKQFNSVIEFINTRSEVTPATEPGGERDAGPLATDSTSRNLRTRLISMVTDRYNKAVPSGSDLYSLGDLGISQVDPNTASRRDAGKIQFDQGMFANALEQDQESVRRMFTASTDDGHDGDGLVARMSPYLGDMTDSNNGLITTRIDGFDRTIGNLEERIERQHQRLESSRGVMERKFRQMESMLAQLQSQQDFLSQRL